MSCKHAPSVLSSLVVESSTFLWLLLALFSIHVLVLDWPWVVLGTSMLELEVGISGFKGCVSFLGFLPRKPS